MILGANRLTQLIEEGCIDAPFENVNGASIDVRIGPRMLFEFRPDRAVVDLASKGSLDFNDVAVPNDSGVLVAPGEFFLAETMETLALPDNICCEFKLRSSVARNGLQHMLAGWADPGFHGKLTLEFVNATQWHNFSVDVGMRIGQLVFFEVEEAGEYSYRHRGRYQDQGGVTASKGA